MNLRMKRCEFIDSCDKRRNSKHTVERTQQKRSSIIFCNESLHKFLL